MRLRLLAATVAATVPLLALGACTGDDEPDPTTATSSATPDDDAVAVPLPAYCRVQALRAMVASGDVAEADLPASADRTVVDGTPRIVDFTQPMPDGESSSDVLDALFDSPGLQGVQVDDDAVEECIASTTNADVERTQGGPGYLDDRR